MSGFGGHTPHSITLDEIADIAQHLPTADEIVSEIRTTHVIYERMRQEIPSAGVLPGFFGIPVFLDDSVDPGEVRFRFADGHAESVRL